MIWLKLVLAVIVTEAVAEILSTSDLLEPLRDRAKRVHRLLGIGASCGYCQSIWFGLGSSMLLGIAPLGLGPWWAEALLWGFVVHRASNVWHEILKRFFDRMPLRLVLHKIEERSEPEKPEEEK